MVSHIPYLWDEITITIVAAFFVAITTTVVDIGLLMAT